MCGVEKLPALLVECDHVTGRFVALDPQPIDVCELPRPKIICSGVVIG